MIKNTILLLVSAIGLAVAAEPNPPPHAVFMIGEDEYLTWETLPAFAKAELEPRGVRVTIVHAETKDKNNFPGLVEALRDADLLLVSVRRRSPAKEQLDAVRAHLNAGKPLIGIRTASHAFALRSNAQAPADAGLAQWPEFDPEVLGGHYTGHHGSGPQTVTAIAPGAESHPILRGLEVAKLASQGSLYKASPLHASCTPLLIGSIPDKMPEPVAWTRSYGPKQGRIFYTSLGHPEDFRNAEFRRLLRNALAWGLQRPLAAAAR